MNKFVFTYMPDVRERGLRFQSELSMEEGLAITEEILQAKDFDVYSEVAVYTTDKESVFDIFPYEPHYHMNDKYKYLEPVVKEMCNRYLLKNQ